MIHIHSSVVSPQGTQNQTNFMQIGLATSEEIQNWSERSYFLDGQFLEIGEVKKADTINYRTFKPEKDGLFCERIFGPVTDWVCSCGQYSGVPGGNNGSNSKGSSKLETAVSQSWISGNFSNSIPDSSLEKAFSQKKTGFGIGNEQTKPRMLWHALRGNRGTRNSSGIQFDSKRWGNSLERKQDSGGFLLSDSFLRSDENRGSGELPQCRICPNCQVELTLSRIRRYRMGYIGLACPVTHIWFLNSRPNIFSVLLKMPTKYVKKINYYKGYSPSQKAYMNPCFGPGGDFFDTEWEFVHRWFGANLNQKLQGILSFPASKVFGGVSFLSPKGGIGGSCSLSHHFPEYPSWLENTGANAFFHHFQNRNWEKEFQKLHYEFRESPQFLSKECFVTSVDKTLPLANFAENQTSVHEDGSDGKTRRETGFAPEKNGFAQKNQKSSFLAPLEHHIHFLLKRRKKKVRKLKLLTLLRTAGHFPFQGFSSERESSTGKESFLNQSLKGMGGSLESLEVGSKVTNEGLMKRGNAGSHKSGESQKGIGKTESLDARREFSNQAFLFTSIPVLPPELRPIVQLNAGQLASSDVNDLYRRLLSRNNRLKYYFNSCGPHLVEFLVRSEQHLVQLSVDALFENGKTGGMGRSGKEASFEGSRDSSGKKQVYKSLSDRIGGKQGRFRQNLLGKRVDYSGRSVIVVGPKLKINQCGLPIEMATELFQAFLIRHILELQLAKTIRGAKNILRYNQGLTRQLLQNVVQSHPILLNRAPTLHRLGIQAFQPKLVSGRAIQLHPLVCTAFNADFDGDQMAVHLPLSAKARVEARLLMLANTNWFSPATGQPSLLPSQDMVLGFYYLTIENPISTKKQTSFQTAERSRIEKNPKQTKFPLFSSLVDVLQGYESGILSLHSQVWVNMENASQKMGARSSHSLSPKTTRLRNPVSFSPENQGLEAELSTQDSFSHISGSFNTNPPPYRKKNSGQGIQTSRQNSFFFSNFSSSNISLEDLPLKEYSFKASDSVAKPGNQTSSNLGGISALPKKLGSLASPTSQGNEKNENEKKKKEIGKMSNLLLTDSKTAPQIGGYSDPSGRPGKNPDEPLFLRISPSARTMKVFSSYKWSEDSTQNRTGFWIRTTPGRILVNHLILSA